MRAAWQTCTRRLATLACNSMQIALHMCDGPQGNSRVLHCIHARAFMCTALQRTHVCVLHCMHAVGHSHGDFSYVYFRLPVSDGFLSLNILSGVLFSVTPHLAFPSRMEWHAWVIKIRALVKWGYASNLGMGRV